MDLSLREIQVGRDADIKAGDWAVIQRMNMVDNQYLLTHIVSVSDKVIATTANLRFSRDGWRFEEKQKYTQRLLCATPELVSHIRRQTLLEQLQSIAWAFESTLTLEMVLATYNANKGVIEDE